MKRTYRVSVVSMLVVALSVSGCGSRDAMYANPPAYMVEQIDELMPAAQAFVAKNQAEALERGTPLTDSQHMIAKKVGLKKPESVRVYYVDSLPEPTDPTLEAAARKFGYSSPFIDAYTFGYGIWIKKDSREDLELLAHELIHVRQMEQLGLEEMIRQYITQLYIYGYRKAPLEQEAYGTAANYL